jgi:hypothetical protein
MLLHHKPGISANKETVNTGSNVRFGPEIERNVGSGMTASYLRNNQCPQLKFRRRLPNPV